MEPRSREHLSAELLQAFLDSDLPPGEVRAVEEHLAGCAHCTEELDSWRALFADLGSLPVHAPQKGFGDRVLAAVDLPRSLSLGARLRRWIAMPGRPREAHVPGEVLQDLLDGALGTRQVARVRKHLDACPTCSTDLAAWRDVYERLSGLEGFAPAPGFAERVLARLRAAPAVVHVPAWRHALAAATRFVPRTRRAWATISGIALTPAVTIGLIVTTVFSHPTLTPRALMSFVAWELADFLASGGSAVGAVALEGTRLLGLDALVVSLLDAPALLAGGALVYSVLSALALRVLYKNLSGGRRYARVSLR